jgi:hypothetical protein
MEHHELKPKYISETSQLNRRVRESDKKTDQARRSKF